MDARRKAQIRTVAYWLTTLIVAWEMIAGSTWDLLQIHHVRAVFERLGYPLYMLYILGAWKFPCAMALLTPRFLRLKEWAYAGAFFSYSGATASHVLAGDRFWTWLAPGGFAVVTLISWGLRPASRRFASQPGKTHPLEWVLAGGVVLGMLGLSLTLLPKA
jgi:hypothetical protein